MITAIQYACQVSDISVVTGAEEREIMVDEFSFCNLLGSGRVTDKPDLTRYKTTLIIDRWHGGHRS